MKKQTPWGRAAEIIVLAKGIESCSTDSHGGIWLSKARQAVVAKAYPGYQNWLGGLEWWEEDCDWAIPYTVFADDLKGTCNYDKALASARLIVSSMEGWGK